VIDHKGVGWLISPHGRVLAAWWNMLICAAIVVVSFVMGITQSPVAFVLTGLGLVMEWHFIRGYLRVRHAKVTATAD